MNAQDVFGIIVRTVGLLAVLTWPAVTLGVVMASGTTDMLWPFFVYLLVALYLLRGAPLLLAFSYPRGRRGALDR